MSILVFSTESVPKSLNSNWINNLKQLKATIQLSNLKRTLHTIPSERTGSGSHWIIFKQIAQSLCSEFLLSRNIMPITTARHNQLILITQQLWHIEATHKKYQSKITI